jgi:hypothetical protein
MQTTGNLASMAIVPCLHAIAFGVADDGLYSIRSLALLQRRRHVLADRDLQPQNEEHWLERFCSVGQTRRHVFRLRRSLYGNIEQYVDCGEHEK